MIDDIDKVIDLNAILHPSSVYDHPRDVEAVAYLGHSVLGGLYRAR